MLPVISAVLTGGSVHAGPHGYEPPDRLLESPEESRARMSAEMESWLRQLLGRYYAFNRITVYGTLKNDFKNGKRPNGMVQTGYLDCTGIGTGPGVLCMVIDAMSLRGRVSNYRITTLIQIGLDPNASKLHMLWAGSDGFVEESSGFWSGDSWNWWFPCAPGPPGAPDDTAGCYRTEKLSFDAESGYIAWTSGRLTVNGGHISSATKYLYRLSPEQAKSAWGPDGLPRTTDDPELQLPIRNFGRRNGPK